MQAATAPCPAGGKSQPEGREIPPGARNKASAGVRIAAVAVGIGALLALSACSSSTSADPSFASGGTNAATSSSFDGVYTGTYGFQGEGTFAVYAAVSPGYNFFVDSNGYTYTLPTLTAGGALSGTMVGYAPLGRAFASGNATETFQVSGAASGTGFSSIAATFSGAGVSGSLTLSLQSLPAPDFSALAGAYSGFYVGPGGTTISGSLSASGSFTGTDGHGCTLTGSLTATGGGLYTLVMNSTGSDSCSAQTTGLAFATAADFTDSFNGAAGTYLYLTSTSSSAALAAELQKD